MSHISLVSMSVQSSQIVPLLQIDTFLSGYLTPSDSASLPLRFFERVMSHTARRALHIAEWRVVVDMADKILGVSRMSVT